MSIYKGDTLVNAGSGVLGLNIDWTQITNKPSFFSGDYNDLTNRPSLFSGSWNDLTDKPTIFSGDYNDLTNLPSLFSGDYGDLSNVPTSFQTNLFEQNADPDANITSPSNGLVYYDSTDDDIRAYVGGSWTSLLGGGGVSDVSDFSGGTFGAGDYTFPQVLTLAGPDPKLRIENTNAATDEKNWEIRTLASTGNLQFFTVNDARDNSEEFLEITRAGLSAFQITVGPSITALILEGAGSSVKAPNIIGDNLLADINGTAGNPVFSWNNEKLTGIYKANVGVLGFSSQGVLSGKIGATTGLVLPVNADPDTNLTAAENGSLAYDSTDHDVRAYVNGAWTSLLGGGASSGSYTPTVTAVQNITIGSGRDGFWQRIGNVVQVFCRIVGTPTASGLTRFRVELPVSTNLGTNDMAGQGAFIISGEVRAISCGPDATNNEALFSCYAENLSNIIFNVSFSYRV